MSKTNLDVEKITNKEIGKIVEYHTLKILHFYNDINSIINIILLLLLLLLLFLALSYHHLFSKQHPPNLLKVSCRTA